MTEPILDGTIVESLSYGISTPLRVDLSRPVLFDDSKREIVRLRSNAYHGMIGDTIHFEPGVYEAYLDEDLVALWGSGVSSIRSFLRVGDTSGELNASNKILFRIFKNGPVEIRFSVSDTTRTDSIYITKDSSYFSMTGLDSEFTNFTVSITHESLPSTISFNQTNCKATIAGVISKIVNLGSGELGAFFKDNAIHVYSTNNTKNITAVSYQFFGIHDDPVTGPITTAGSSEYWYTEVIINRIPENLEPTHGILA